MEKYIKVTDLKNSKLIFPGFPSELQKEEIEKLSFEDDRIDKAIESENIFAVGFYNWMTYDPDASGYKLLELSAKELLDIYRNRPFISTDTLNQ